VNPVCIYHSNCCDGWTAAWVVHRYFEGAVDLVPAQYGDPAPDLCRDRQVIVVDFSYKKDELVRLGDMSAGLLVLDHHKTAEEDLRRWSIDWPETNLPRLPKKGEILAFFDMDRSGASLAWDWFFPGKKKPQLIKHVEDRDLWKFRIEGSKTLHGVFTSYPYDIETWDKLEKACEDMTLKRRLLREGEAISRKHLMDVSAIIKATKRNMVIGGYPVLVCNVPPTMASDVGNVLASMQLFGATYFDDHTGKRIFSLRSKGDFDVAHIAKSYGGGGHRNAAGFTRSRGWEGD
jgi:hypothetical protein